MAEKDIHYYEPASGHGLKHDPFNAIVAPRPIGWISSRDTKGSINLRYRAAPLYYGMLMFAQAAPGSLIPAQLAPDTSGLKAFAVRAPDETLCVCLINQNITRDERVAIDSGRKFYCRVRCGWQDQPSMPPAG